MEELICNECKGRKFRKISASEYECEYCGSVIKETVQPQSPKVVIVQQPAQPQPIVTPFPPEISFRAGLREGFNILSGRLIIYPDKFVYEPDSVNFGGNLSPREWRIVNIAGYIKGFASLLDIKMKESGKIRFSVIEKGTIINALEDRRKFWLENK